MRAIILVSTLLFTTPALSAARIVHPWTSVHIETGSATVDAHTNADGSRLTGLRVHVGKRSIKAPRSALSELPHPRLETIQVMWDCWDATGEFGSQQRRDTCTLFISIEYDDSPEGRTYDQDHPRKSLVFRNGEFIETIVL